MEDRSVRGILAIFLLFAGCCASTTKTETNSPAEQAIVDSVLNSTCVGKMTIWDALYIDARDHIGSDAKWYSFTLKNSDSDYTVYVNWKNGDEKYDYKFSYNTMTKKIESVNKEARLVLDTCRSA